MNFMTGIIAVAIGGIYLITAMLLPQMRMGDKLGPKLFPTIIGIVAIASGIILMIQDKRPGKASKKADFGFIKNKDLWLKILLTTMVGIVYGLVMDSLGFILPTTLFMLFISMLINKGRLVQNIIVALSFAVICYGVFGVALKLSLPRGFIEQMLPF
ncbi:MAG: tripartite tricarboxylate transporter TctB family protein [Spirochaetales bacterium]